MSVLVTLAVAEALLFAAITFVNRKDLYHGRVRTADYIMYVSTAFAVTALVLLLLGQAPFDTTLSSTSTVVLYWLIANAALAVVSWWYATRQAVRK